MTANRRICIVRHSTYPQDVRVFKETRALLADGWEVDVICRRRPGQLAREIVDGIRVRRILGHQKRGGRLRYALEYTATFLLMGAILSGRSVRHPYDVVQVNTLPDALVFAAWFARLRGSRILLDLHEPAPEMVMMRFGYAADHWLVRMIARWEQRSIRFAHHALAVNDTIRQRYIDRGAKPAKLSVVRNVPGVTFMESAESGAARDGFVLSIHGTVEPRYGHETILKALPRLRADIPEVKLLITGTGNIVDRLKALTEELNCRDIVEFVNRVPFPEMARHLSGVHVGLVPLMPGPFSELCQPNKLFEYIALGVPVVASRFPAIEETFPDEEICYFNGGDAEDLAKQILRLYRDPEGARQMAAAAEARFQQLQWAVSQRAYVRIVKQVSQHEIP